MKRDNQAEKGSNPAKVPRSRVVGHVTGMAGLRDVDIQASPNSDYIEL